MPETVPNVLSEQWGTINMPPKVLCKQSTIGVRTRPKAIEEPDVLLECQIRFEKILDIHGPVYPGIHGFLLVGKLFEAVQLNQ